MIVQLATIVLGVVGAVAVVGTGVLYSVERLRAKRRVRSTLQLLDSYA